MTPITSTSAAPIAYGYTAKSLEKKGGNKSALQEELHWPVEPKRLMVCLPAGMSDALGGGLLEGTLEGILSLPVEVLILGKGSSRYGSLFTALRKKHGHRIHIVPNTEGAVAKMLAASDAALFFADPSELAELRHCLAFGVIPIAPESPLLENYNPVQESGNAFVYGDLSPWHCFAALVRAAETYKLPFDWRTIQKHCMRE